MSSGGGGLRTDPTQPGPHMAWACSATRIATYAGAVGGNTDLLWIDGAPHPALRPDRSHAHQKSRSGTRSLHKVLDGAHEPYQWRKNLPARHRAGPQDFSRPADILHRTEKRRRNSHNGAFVQHAIAFTEDRPVSLKHRGREAATTCAFNGQRDHSHSIVPGGLLVTSKTTRLMPRTSLTIRPATRVRNPMSNGYTSAVMPSVLVTARSPHTWS